MHNIPFKVWYGGFAQHVLENVVSEEARGEYKHLSIAKQVFEHYRDPVRVYHNAYHPYWMYQFAWERDIILTRAQELAILFHDVIYTPGDKRNETRSAEMCYDLMWPEVVEHEIVMTACEIIEDTAQHFKEEPKLGTWESQLVLDLDIMNMTLPYTLFKEWNAAVVDEYTNWFGDMDKEKRLEFLKFFLNRKPILQSELLKGLEPLIIDNLMALIQELEMEMAT